VLFEFDAVAKSPSKVPLDIRVELLETNWEKDDDLGTASYLWLAERLPVLLQLKMLRH
jgi:hypothetical protein